MNRIFSAITRVHSLCRLQSPSGTFQPSRQRWKMMDGPNEVTWTWSPRPLERGPDGMKTEFVAPSSQGRISICSWAPESMPCYVKRGSKGKLRLALALEEWRILTRDPNDVASWVTLCRGAVGDDVVADLPQDRTSCTISHPCNLMSLPPCSRALCNFHTSMRDFEKGFPPKENYFSPMR